MRYVVFEHLQNRRFITNPDDLPVKIHKDSCRFYINRKIMATTVRWHESFETEEKAEEYAQHLGKPYRRAKCCP